jgi:hypothetical protein
MITATIKDVGRRVKCNGNGRLGTLTSLGAYKGASVRILLDGETLVWAIQTRYLDWA